ncbi:hypothetical protein CEXT_198301 [Caerostris extrusa]|uniref:Uncharacterized protein n=1 Tax=Caerostris extrusa TaxID=172846 RepID=A0AAV4MAL3_CAEEX|nr:hypothetical protein CEXT_198301 [Caerostris extrusa]
MIFPPSIRRTSPGVHLRKAKVVETPNRRAASPAAVQRLRRRAETIRANFTPPQPACFPFRFSGSPPAARLSRLDQTPGVFATFRGST